MIILRIIQAVGVAVFENSHLQQAKVAITQRIGYEMGIASGKVILPVVGSDHVIMKVNEAIAEDIQKQSFLLATL